jgi:hypothetical protein
MHWPLEQLRLQLLLESHVMSHFPPEQSTEHGSWAPHVPVHAPPEQLQLPPVHGSGFDGVPGGIGSGSDGRPELHATTSRKARRFMTSAYANVTA